MSKKSIACPRCFFHLARRWELRSSTTVISCLSTGSTRHSFTTALSSIQTPKKRTDFVARQSRSQSLSLPCHTRATEKYTRNYAVNSPTTPEERPLLVNLTHRRLLAVHGQDAAHFLQGLTTNNVPTTWAASTRDGFYSAFLNAQGRLLHDVFIYPATASRFFRNTLLPERGGKAKGHNDPGFIIEADAEGTESLYKHLRRYKLRAKVDMWIVDDAQAAPLGIFESNVGNGQRAVVHWDDGTLRAIDNRAPGFGSRVIVSPGSEYAKSLRDKFEEVTLHTYHQARHVIGIAEGQSSTGDELPYGNCLPHETNVDLMGGIDFRKGCYVGQELTIRTQHKGVTDLGLVATVQNWVKAGAMVDIIPKDRRGRPAGRWVAGVASEQNVDSPLLSNLNGRIGLATCRLEMMTDVVVEAGGDGGGVRYKEGDQFVLRPKWGDGSTGVQEDIEISISAQVPSWIRKGIENRTKRGVHDRAVDSESEPMEAVG